MESLLSVLGPLIERAAAQPISGAAQQAAGPLVGNFAGGSGFLAFNNLAILLWEKSWVLAAIAATYNIVRAGIRLISGQEEDKLSKARRTILLSLVAVMALYLVPRIIQAIYTGGGNIGIFDTPAGVFAGASIFAEEVYGLLRWITVLVLPVAIGMIVIAAFRVISTFGKEDALPVMRRAVASVGAGIVLIFLDPVIKNTLGVSDSGLGTPSTGPLIARAIGIVNTVLLLLALLSVVMVAYAGIRLVLSLGNEEEQTKAKGLLLRVAIGILILSVSYAFTQFIVNLTS